MSKHVQTEQIQYVYTIRNQVIYLLVYHQVITSSALACLGEYSHANNLSKKIVALYLYASGTTRQTISVFSKLGICESWTNILNRTWRRKSKDTTTSEEPETRQGTLYQLAASMMCKARELASKGLYQEIYDNVNIVDKSAEQIIGRHGAWFQ